MSRWSHFRENAGTFGVVRTIFSAGLVATFGAVGAGFDRWDMPAGALLGLALPYLARRPLADRVDGSLQLLRLWGFAIMAGTFVIGYGRDRWPWLVESPMGGILVALLGAYVASYFWLLSDEQVVRLE